MLAPLLNMMVQCYAVVNMVSDSERSERANTNCDPNNYQHQHVVAIRICAQSVARSLRSLHEHAVLAVMN